MNNENEIFETNENNSVINNVLFTLGGLHSNHRNELCTITRTYSRDILTYFSFEDVSESF